jgi:hypothetical protein
VAPLEARAAAPAPTWSGAADAGSRFSGNDAIAYSGLSQVDRDDVESRLNRAAMNAQVALKSQPLNTQSLPIPHNVAH